MSLGAPWPQQAQGSVRAGPVSSSTAVSTSRCLCMLQQSPGQGEVQQHGQALGHGDSCFRLHSMALPAGETKERLREDGSIREQYLTRGGNTPGKGEGCWPVTAQGPCLGGLLSSGGGRRCSLSFWNNHSPMPKRDFPCQAPSPRPGYFHPFLRAAAWEAWDAAGRMRQVPWPRVQGRGAEYGCRCFQSHGLGSRARSSLWGCH